MADFVIIKDQPCGTGKTTAMIKELEEGKKYLIILPLLSEVTRVLRDSKTVRFLTPDETDNDKRTKAKSLELMVQAGANIATTHALYLKLASLANQGLLDDYHIIIDEVPEVAEVKATKSATSIHEFYIETGYMKVDESSGLVEPLWRWLEKGEEVSDTLDNEILSAAQSGCLYLQDNRYFISALPKSLLSSGQSVTVMTYKSEGSMLSLYLERLGIPTRVVRDQCLDVEFRLKAAELITVEDVPSLADVAFSYTKQVKNMSDKKVCSAIAGSLRKLRERKLKDVDINHILVTSLKDAWYLPSKGSKKAKTTFDADNEQGSDDHKPGVFAKDSRLQKATWIPNTTRGTNDYIHCSHLIYLYDQSPNPILARWLGDNSEAFRDAYALTELIQWVWRSRIRIGEPITLYLPSPRMLRLFEEWLYGDEVSSNERGST